MKLEMCPFILSHKGVQVPVANVNTATINTPEIFNLLQKWGNIQLDEMYGTFNMGIGMVIVIKAEEVEAVKSFLEEKGEEYSLLGEITRGDKGLVLCRQ